MKKSAIRWLKFAGRWSIALAGIGWLVSNMSFSDRVAVLDQHNRLIERPLVDEVTESDRSFHLAAWRGMPQQWLEAREMWTRADRKSLRYLNGKGKTENADLIGYQPSTRFLLLRDRNTGAGIIAPTSAVEGGYRPTITYPKVDIGLTHLVRQAKGWLLLAALFSLLPGFVLWSLRWQWLLRAQDIRISLRRAFVLNMVGGFYSTFLPGSTGGDLVKAYYASQQTTYPVRAVLSVLMDRLIGLVALIVVGTTMAWLQWSVPACRAIAEAGFALLIFGGFFGTVLFVPAFRRAGGLNRFLTLLPFQSQVRLVIEAMDIYYGQPLVLARCLLITVPLHLCSIISAMFAGQAFGLGTPLLFYSVLTPVIALASAIPLTPHGAGVMEFLVVEMTRSQGVTVSQAVALAMTIRLAALIWGASGALFLVRGGQRVSQHDISEFKKPDTIKSQLLPVG